jgi:hypothetical protein
MTSATPLFFLSIKEIEKKENTRHIIDNTIRITVEYDEEAEVYAYCVYTKRGETTTTRSEPYRFWAYRIHDVIQYLRFVTDSNNQLNVTLYSGVFDEDNYTGDDHKWFSQFETLSTEVVGFLHNPLSSLEKTIVNGLRVLKQLNPC